MLVDKYNRVIDYLRVSVTDRCNLRCKYCVDGEFPFVAHDEILRYEEIIRFVRICSELGVTKVRLTGGEPLTRKGIPFLLKEIFSIKGINDVSLTTNGVFLGRQILDLKEAGLKRVNISLDTLKRERFTEITRVDAFDEVLMSIEKAMYTGIRPIKINTVVIKDFNDDEILSFARLAKKWGLEVRFIEFMPFGDSALWDSSRIVPSRVIEERIRTEYPLEPLSNATKGPAKMYGIAGSEGKVGFISPVSTHICSECNRIRLTSTGMIRPCLFSDTEYDMKSLMRRNAGDEEIREFVESVVEVKPANKHEKGQIRKCQRNLRSIGG
ncbi:MAG: Cyclic pyranopterin monophosphate synthase [Syntrophorhabdus sp. PtaU1.Bin058]|nr:MAG: Cyclic pyranopterin monophosphate synthase [Syntrophorhabdus sp. PtaU1.Bin058]